MKNPIYNGNQAAVLRAIEDGIGNRDEIMRATGLNYRQVATSLRRLKDTRRILEEAGRYVPAHHGVPQQNRLTLAALDCWKGVPEGRIRYEPEDAWAS